MQKLHYYCNWHLLISVQAIYYDTYLCQALMYICKNISFMKWVANMAYHQCLLWQAFEIWFLEQICKHTQRHTNFWRKAKSKNQPCTTITWPTSILNMRWFPPCHSGVNNDNHGVKDKITSHLVYLVVTLYLVYIKLW